MIKPLQTFENKAFINGQQPRKTPSLIHKVLKNISTFWKTDRERVKQILLTSNKLKYILKIISVCVPVWERGA